MPSHASLMSVFVKEELAFVFEMLQQFEDALVQYDELDALFTQYVLNFGAGGKLAPPTGGSQYARLLVQIEACPLLYSQS